MAELNYTFGIVICNPPYLTSKLDDKILNKGVLQQEPSLAYLVPSKDSLLFYRQVAMSISNQQTAEAFITSPRCTKRRKSEHKHHSRLAVPMLRLVAL